MDILTSLFGGVTSLLGWFVVNPGKAATIIAALVLFGLYIFAKPWFDVLARAANVVLEAIEIAIKAFEKRWKESKAFRDFVTIGGGTVICLVAVWAVFNGGRNFERTIWENKNEIIELRRQVESERQRRANAEYERDRNLQANIDAMQRQEELERQNVENEGEINDLRERLKKGPNCEYPLDEYNRMRDYLRGK